MEKWEFVVDGSNLAHRGHRPSSGHAERICAGLVRQFGLSPDQLTVLVDGHMQHLFPGAWDHRAGELYFTPSGLPADEYILGYALGRRAIVVSTDRYRDQARRAGILLLQPLLVKDTMVLPEHLLRLSKEGEKHDAAVSLADTLAARVVAAPVVKGPRADPGLIEAVVAVLRADACAMDLGRLAARCDADVRNFRERLKAEQGGPTGGRLLRFVEAHAERVLVTLRGRDAHYVELWEPTRTYIEDVADATPEPVDLLAALPNAVEDVVEDEAEDAVEDDAEDLVEDVVADDGEPLEDAIERIVLGWENGPPRFNMLVQQCVNEIPRWNQRLLEAVRGPRKGRASRYFLQSARFRLVPDGSSASMVHLVGEPDIELRAFEESSDQIPF